MANFTCRVQWAQTAVQEEELEKKHVLCYFAIGPMNFLCVIFLYNFSNNGVGTLPPLIVTQIDQRD